MLEKKLKSLDQIRADILSKNICLDLAQEAKNLVMGHGDLNAEIVFIGEAPGKLEDEAGKPFVGASGKFLDCMLEKIGLDRTNVFITNIVKYRPPKNRDPLQKEKEDFLPFLYREIELIKPKIIVTLGRHSMEFFLPGRLIGEVHGMAFDVDVNGHKIQLLPLYHPAAAMYKGSLRSTLEQDFLKIKKLIKKLN